MLHAPAEKYRPFVPVGFPQRTWPDRRLVAAPRWCSTDLRDGNQALAVPMDLARKQRLFDLLVAIGFREIEVAFPAASQVEYDFVRGLIDQQKIPPDVTIQVMTQAREALIARTFEALHGVPRAIVHVYNATAPLFRRVVFGQGRAETVALAVEATRLVREQCERAPQTAWTYQYSPETFCFTEPDFALEICEAVIAAWQPTAERPLILNLPTTVEVAMPNVFADQIEWFCQALSSRQHVTISIHPHNDRGTAVATAEQALLAGAERVEGCLFGNGERTGNVDLLTLALNLYTQGIAPGLDFSDIDEVRAVLEWCNGLPVHPRHPYAGELVYTAFSGSHQDAIRKGFAARQAQNGPEWEIPYLPLDPADVGRSYEAVIRVNSQSGKGGAAWIVEQELGIRLPYRLQVDFGQQMQQAADASGHELGRDELVALFLRCYGRSDDPQGWALGEYGLERRTEQCCLAGELRQGLAAHVVQGIGNGPLSALVAALAVVGVEITIDDYSEHALGSGAMAQAVAFVEGHGSDGKARFGMGIDADTGHASLLAVMALVNGCVTTA